MINIFFKTLGCPKNEVDSEYMMGLLEDRYKIIDNINEAQVVIINTCGFIKDAKEESIEAILQAAEYENKKLLVTGCLSQRYSNKLSTEIPEIDAIMGTGKLDNIKQIVDQIIDGKKLNKVGKPGFNFTHRIPRKLTNDHYAYVKIAEGCNNNCTYCCIPQLRGNVQSRTIDDIYKETENLVAKGVKEIILVAQDTTRYGIDIYNKPALTELLKNIVKIDDLRWLRILYSYPEHINNSLLEIIKKESKICNYLDIPIQHAANKIRKLMNREGKKEELIEFINRLRKNIPDIVLRTSLITGFPGENDEDFQELINFVKTIEFDRLGVFKYSREENTAAADFKEQVDEDIKQRRYNQIMNIQQQISRKKNREYIGKSLNVIIDEVDQEYAFARSQYDAPEIDNQVIIKDKTLQTGKIVNCKIKNAYEYDLIGER